MVTLRAEAPPLACRHPPAGGGAALGGGASPEVAVTVAESLSLQPAVPWVELLRPVHGGSASIFNPIVRPQPPRPAQFSRFVPNSAAVPSPRDGQERPGGGWPGSGWRRCAAPPAAAQGRGSLLALSYARPPAPVPRRRSELLGQPVEKPGNCLF